MNSPYEVSVSSFYRQLRVSAGPGHATQGVTPGNVRVSAVESRRESEECVTATISVVNQERSAFEGIIELSLAAHDDDARYFLPGFLYNRNRPHVQDKKCPALLPGTPDLPSSPYWLVRSDRLSHPLACVVGREGTMAIAGSPFLCKSDSARSGWKPGVPSAVDCWCGFGCSLEDGGSISYTIGYENAPQCYISHDEGFVSTPPGHVLLAPGEELNLEVLLFHSRSADPLTVNRVIRAAYKHFHQPPPDKNFPDAARSVSSAVCTDAWIPSIRNFACRVHRPQEIGFRPEETIDKDGLYQIPMSTISWTAGAVCAAPAVMAGLRFGENSWREAGVECFDHIVDHSMNEQSGLPFDGYDAGKGVWANGGWWGWQLPRVGHSSYLTGSFVYYLLKAYHYEKTLGGTTHDTWLTFAKTVIKRCCETRDPDGFFAYLWADSTGEGIDYDAMSGVWCLAAGLLLARITGDRALVKELQPTEDAYYRKFVSQMECYGTPLDTYKAVDSEGILPYIRSAQLLHEITGEERYLSRLVTALEYEFSFRFCWNVPIETPPLSKLGWPTCGGSITSTNNPHIHPMSCGITDELAYAARLTNDPYLASRLDDSRKWSLHTANAFDGEQDFGLKGWMSERFCHSQGLLTERYPDGNPSSVWFVFLPWAAGNVLEGWLGEQWRD